MCLIFVGSVNSFSEELNFTFLFFWIGYWPKMENLKFWLWLVNLELEKLSLPNWSLSIWQLSTSLLQIWSLNKFLKLCPCLKALVILKPTEMTTHLGKYILDVLCQPIKLIQVFLLQNVVNIDGTTLILFFSSPPFNAGPQKPRTLTAPIIKYDNFWPKI